VAAVEKALCQVQAASSRRQARRFARLLARLRPSAGNRRHRRWRKALEQEQQVDVGGGAQLAIGGRAKQRGGDE
jgi:hypothetical protein